MSGERPTIRETAPVVLSALAGALLFYSGIFAFLFAIPIQVTFSGRGARKGLTAAAIAASLIVVIHLLQVVGLEARQAEMVRLLFLDSLMPLGLLAGLSLFNMLEGHPWWARLLTAAGIAMLGAIPSLRLLALAATGEGPLTEQVNAMVDMLGGGDSGELIETVGRIAFNTVGVGLTAAIAANWWLGRNIVLRRFGMSQSLRRARVADELVWMVIGGLALVILAWTTETGWVQPIGWNALLIGAFLYGVHALGLVQHLLRRRGMSESVERWVPTVTLVLLFVPAVNVLVLVGLPLLGMSEVWVDYKRGEEYEGDSEQ